MGAKPIFTPDRNTFATTAGLEKKVLMWDLEKLPDSGHTALPLPSEDRPWSAELLGHEDFITTLAFSPDGKLLVSGSNDGCIKVWDWKNKKEVTTLHKGNTHLLAPRSRAFAFSPDGKRLAAGVPGERLVIWETGNWKETWSADRQFGGVLDLSFSHDGEMLAVARLPVSFAEVRVGERLEIKFKPHHNKPIMCLAFSPKERKLATGSLDKTVKIWDFRN